MYILVDGKFVKEDEAVKKTQRGRPPAQEQPPKAQPAIAAK